VLFAVIAASNFGVVLDVVKKGIAREDVADSFLLR
jgi:hypothetical protein